MNPQQFSLEQKKDAYILKYNKDPRNHIEQIDYYFFGDEILVVVFKREDSRNSKGSEHSLIVLFRKSGHKVLKEFTFFYTKHRKAYISDKDRVCNIISVKRDTSDFLVTLAMQKGKPKFLRFK